MMAQYSSSNTIVGVGGERPGFYGIVPKNRFRGSMCSLPNGHGILVFGGRGGGDGDGWFMWNINWRTKYLQNGTSISLNSNIADSSESGSGYDTESSDMSSGSGGRHRSDSTDSTASDGSEVGGFVFN